MKCWGVKVRFVRSADLQPQNFAAPLINDRFSRGIAAVAGCVPRTKDGLLRSADLGVQSSIWGSVAKA